MYSLLLFCPFVLDAGLIYTVTCCVEDLLSLHTLEQVYTIYVVSYNIVYPFYIYCIRTYISFHEYFLGADVRREK